MKPADADAFSLEMVKAAEIHREQLSEARIVAYFEILAKCELDDLRDAFKAHSRSCKFFPKPSELIELIEGSLEDQAELAWMDVRKVIRGEAQLQVVAHSDPAITPAVYSVFGGWLEAQQVRTDDLPFRRRDFIRCYRTMATRQRDTGIPATQLPASAERHLHLAAPSPGDRRVPMRALEPPAAPSRQEIKSMVAKVMELPEPEDRWPKDRRQRIKAQVEALKAKYPDAMPGPAASTGEST
jgi:hypothetical protein